MTRDVDAQYLDSLENSLRTKDRSRPGRQVSLNLNGTVPAVEVAAAAAASTAA